MEQFGKFNVVSEEIRRLRTEKDLTQDQLAARCSVLGCNLSRGTLAKIEAGIRGVNVVELYTLALALGVLIIDLFPKNFAQNLKRGKYFDSRKMKKP